MIPLGKSESRSSVNLPVWRRYPVSKDTVHAVYPSCSIKRHRRSKVGIGNLKDAILGIAQAEHPVTCRQLFYRMVSAGHVAKTETDYNNVVIRLVSEMREQGRMPWSWITDGTRLMRKPETYNNLTEALEATKQYYRRDLWRDQDMYVEVWCEKDALTRVIYSVTAKWGVLLMITRGSPVRHSYMVQPRIPATSASRLSSTT